jgi:type VI secretion system protein ImpJ
MSSQQKIVWSEGLFLQPQHFQQQERYVEYLVDARVRASTGYGWGFERLEIDEATLQLGKLALSAARGVFPDGTPFEFPGAALGPEALSIPDDARDDLVVLVLPMSRAGLPDIASGEDDAVAVRRHALRVAEIADTTSTDGQTAAVQLAPLQPRLMLARDAPDGTTTLGVAQVVERDAANRVTLDASYIPPCLSCRDHRVLSGYARELEGLLQQRAESIAAALGQPGRSGVGEVADFLLLQVVNRYGALFAHLARHPALHPERLYSICLEAAAELCTFSRDSRRPGAYPEYAHDDLRRCFGFVMADLRRSLSMVIERSAIQIELQDRNYGVRVAIVPDRDLFKTAVFVLAVTAQMPGEAVRGRFPAQVKIGPAERLRDLVNLQLPGVALRPLPVAPRQIPYHAGANYFELERDSDLWRQLDRSGGLAMHIAGEFPGLELEFWAIRGG